MNEEFEYVNTTDLQLTSLVAFCNALGYDEVYDQQGRLLRFKAPRFRCCGDEYMSVKRAIRLHNCAPHDIWGYITTVNTDFNSFLNTPNSQDLITALFAGTCKIIDTVKGQFSRKKGFFVHNTKSNHMVKFVTKRDYAHYRHYVGE